MFSCVATKLQAFSSSIRRLSSLHRTPTRRIARHGTTNFLRSKGTNLSGCETENLARFANQNRWASTKNNIDDSYTADEFRRVKNTPNIATSRILTLTIADAIKMGESGFEKHFSFEKKTEEQISEYQKASLGILFKRALPTNPFCEKSRFDQRWMGTTVHDEVMTLLIKDAKEIEEATTIYALRAPSGAGKTGAIYELSHHTFMFYTECGREVRDHVDWPYLTFANKVDGLIYDEEFSKFHPAKVSQLLIQYCTIFWLSYALALEILGNKFPGKKLSTRDWLYWSTNGGGKTIAAIQSQLNHYFEMSGYINPQEIQTELLDPLLLKHKVWIVVDEAQLIFDKAQGKILSSTGPKRSLLSALLLYSFNPSTKRIVAGTGLSKVEEVLKTSVAKRSSIYSQAESSMRFPLLTPQEVKALLYNHLNLEEIERGCNESQLQRFNAVINYATLHLQGRPRFVASLLDILVDKEYAAKGSLDLRAALNPPKSIDEAIELLDIASRVAFDKMLSSCQTLLINAVNKQPTPAAKRMLVYHLMDIGMSSMLDDVTFDPKELERDFGIGPEDLGVVAFKLKRQKYPGLTVLHYAVCEPKLLDVLWEWLRTTYSEIFQPKACSTLYLALKSVDNAQKGYLFEKIVAMHLLDANMPAIQVSLPGNGQLALKPSWRVYGYAAHLRPLTEISDQIRGIKSDAKIFFQTKDQALFQSIIQRLQANKYLQQVIWDEETLLLCTQILGIANEDYVNELLFMLVKPKDILIHPSSLCGPDLIGYIDDVVVATAFSLRNTVSNEKYNSNVETLKPWNWHKSTGNGVKTIALALFKKFCPALSVGINFTVPHTTLHKKAPYYAEPVAPPQSTKKMVIMDISENSLELKNYLGESLVQPIKDWLKEHQEQKAERYKLRVAREAEFFGIQTP